MHRQTKLDLTLFHRLVKELEASLKEAYDVRDGDAYEKNMDSYYEFVIRISKSLGYLTGIANEAQLLGSDLNKLTQNSITDFLKGKDDTTKSLQDYIKSLSDVFAGGTKGSTGSSGGNVN